MKTKSELEVDVIAYKRMDEINRQIIEALMKQVRLQKKLIKSYKLWLDIDFICIFGVVVGIAISILAIIL